MDDETYSRRIAFWLRGARERAGLTQGQVAEHLGLSPKSKSSISDYESGRTTPPIQVLRHLAELYGVPLELLTEPGPTTDDRIDEIVRIAAERERADWDAAAGRSPSAGAGRAAGRRR